MSNEQLSLNGGLNSINRMGFLHQLIKYGAVGLATNLLLYFAYLAVTFVGLSPIIAMSLLYVVGVLLSFWANRNWTFVHQGLQSVSFRRYIVTYLLGYLINLSALYVLVERYALPHQLVQGCLIIFLALFLFALQKVWVFSDRKSST